LLEATGLNLSAYVIVGCVGAASAKDMLALFGNTSQHLAP